MWVACTFQKDRQEVARWQRQSRRSLRLLHVFVSTCQTESRLRGWWRPLRAWRHMWYECGDSPFAACCSSLLGEVLSIQKLPFTTPYSSLHAALLWALQRFRPLRSLRWNHTNWQPDNRLYTYSATTLKPLTALTAALTTKASEESPGNPMGLYFDTDHQSPPSGATWQPFWSMI